MLPPDKPIPMPIKPMPPHNDDSADEVQAARSIGESTAIRLSLVLGFVSVFGMAVWWASGVQSDLAAIKLSIARYARIDDLERRTEMVERYGPTVILQRLEALDAKVGSLERAFELHRATTPAGGNGNGNGGKP